MKRFRRALTVFVLSGASMAAWYGVGGLIDNVQFARAEQKVELSRQQLQNVQDVSGAFREVAKAVEPSVVKIDVKKTVHLTQNDMQQDDDLLRRFLRQREGDDQQDMPQQQEDQQLQGEGSGVIMETDGSNAYILTNNHVAGGATDIVVTLADGREITSAKVIGADPKSDLAVVRIPVTNVIPAHWGDSSYLQKGDFILAFGSPFGYVGSMTHGIVSALNRDRVGIIGSQFAYENFIQVDAPINPGNSGGPLVNLKGEVVGINTAIATNTRSFAGIGFAIPSNQAKPIYEQLKEKGKVVRGWLGVEIQDVSIAKDVAKSLGFTGEHGIIVHSTLKESPATGTLRSGDIITTINGKQVDTVNELRNQVAMTPPDTSVKLTIWRDGKNQDVSVKIGEQPEDLLSRATRGTSDGGDSTATTSAEKLGVHLATPSDELEQRFNLGDVKGAVVTAVQRNSVAAMAGLKAGDVITRVGDKEIASAKDATEALSSQDLAAGTRLYVTNKDGDRLVFVKTNK